MPYSPFTVQATVDMRTLKSEVDSVMRKVIKIKDYPEIKIATGEEIIRLARKNEYTPYDKGDLDESAHVNNAGEIIYNPVHRGFHYGRLQYHLNEWTDYKHRTDYHHNVTDKWVEVTLQNHKPEIEQRVAQIYKQIWERDFGGG